MFLAAWKNTVITWQSRVEEVKAAASPDSLSLIHTFIIHRLDCQLPPICISNYLDETAQLTRICPVTSLRPGRMPIEVVPLSEADIPGAIEVIQQAFADDPYFQWVFDSPNVSYLRNPPRTRPMDSPRPCTSIRHASPASGRVLAPKRGHDSINDRSLRSRMLT